MNGLTAALTPWLGLLYALPIGQAAWTDIRFRRISNKTCATVFAIGIALRALGGITPLAISLALALGIFAALFVFWIMRLIGGGDVKLAAACAAGLSPVACTDFLFVTILFGGFLGIAYMLLARARCQAKHVPRSTPARLLAIEASRARLHHSMPYSLAIAAGFAFALLTTANGT